MAILVQQRGFLLQSFPLRPSHYPSGQRRGKRHSNRIALHCKGVPDDKSKASLTLEDVSYVAKLTAGSIVSGALIKYGSLLLPDITKPNFTEALFIIGIPVMVSVFLLLKASIMERT
eukprot:TRINITY_DN35986_c0_g1_i1.p1 TRINITY_DN35986_c0_g1~~TRINITY_DN35986_c0_g1_i1.p1  ORF type:complete len:117 (-),score=12.58 TRINITY_DN35986_c0_g1_i1:274-624(-)